MRCKKYAKVGSGFVANTVPQGMIGWHSTIGIVGKTVVYAWWAETDHKAKWMESGQMAGRSKCRAKWRISLVVVYGMDLARPGGSKAIMPEQLNNEV